MHLGPQRGQAAGAAAADGCETVPADKSAMDYTFTAAYAASPPAIDEVAFTMEVENLMALTYGGDFMQYKPVSGQSPGVCVADMGAPGNTQTIIGATSAYRQGITGAGVDVALIDSGVTPTPS